MGAVSDYTVHKLNQILNELVPEPPEKRYAEITLVNHTGFWGSNTLGGRLDRLVGVHTFKWPFWTYPKHFSLTLKTRSYTVALIRHNKTHVKIFIETSDKQGLVGSVVLSLFVAIMSVEPTNILNTTL